MKTRGAAYGIIGVFVIAERLLRRDLAARTLQAQPTDRGTTRLIGAAFGFALSAGLAAPFLSRAGVGRIGNTRVPTIGLAVMLAGMVLRVWAARTLGHFYTRTLRVFEDQPVVRSGPYRRLRHPGYAADLLLWLGFGLASGNAIVALCIELPMLTAYHRRIAAQEAMLLEKLGEPYREYVQQTWRMLPPVY